SNQSRQQQQQQQPSSYHSDSFTSLAELTPVSRPALGAPGTGQHCRISGVHFAPSEVSMSTETRFKSADSSRTGVSGPTSERALSRYFGLSLTPWIVFSLVHPGSVAVFYALLPRSKELAKSLQRCSSVLLPSSQELYQFVSKANLMPDFGGAR
uniref:Solute carrier family 40 protein n=1 Tax=Macrostomum lignano TaxID=282301 RepID=A0A1I8F2U6_9PLAT